MVAGQPRTPLSGSVTGAALPGLAAQVGHARELTVRNAA